MLDCIREVRPPFRPRAWSAEFADLLKRYASPTSTATDTPASGRVEQFAKHGIRYEPSKDPKGAIYLNLLPMLNSGKVKLLGNRRLVSQLISLERNTAAAARTGSTTRAAVTTTWRTLSPVPAVRCGEASPDLIGGYGCGGTGHYTPDLNPQLQQQRARDRSASSGSPSKRTSSVGDFYDRA